MANQEAIITIIIYNFLLIAIGFLAKERTSNQDDFYLGGRGLGPWVVTALSASASSSSAWSLSGSQWCGLCLGSIGFLAFTRSLGWLCCQLDMGGSSVDGNQSKNRGSYFTRATFWRFQPKGKNNFVAVNHNNHYLLIDRLCRCSISGSWNSIL